MSPEKESRIMSGTVITENIIECSKYSIFFSENLRDSVKWMYKQNVEFVMHKLTAEQRNRLNMRQFRIEISTILNEYTPLKWSLKPSCARDT